MVSFEIKLSIFLIVSLSFEMIYASDEKSPSDKKVIKTKYQKIYEAIKPENIVADMNNYKSMCMDGIRLMCTKNNKECKNISDYANAILEFIIYDKMLNLYAKSFVDFVWEKIKTIKKAIKNPSTFCIEISKDKSEASVCENTITNYNLISKRFYESFDTLKSMYYLWSRNDINKIKDEEKKSILTRYLEHHIGNYTINDPLLMQESDIPEYYCQKKMCLYELKLLYSPMFCIFRKTDERRKNFIFNNIIFDNLKYPLQKYFVAHLYNSIEIPDNKIKRIPRTFCLRFNVFEQDACANDMIKANFKGITLKPCNTSGQHTTERSKSPDAWLGRNDDTLNICYEFNLDVIVEEIYFEWSHKRSLNQFGLINYVGEYIEHVANNCIISNDNKLGYEYKPEEFCKKAELT